MKNITFAWLCLGLALTALAVNARAAKAVEIDTPPCDVAPAELLTQVDSAYSRVGEPFMFRVKTPVPASGDIPAIAAGTPGYGVVALSKHAAGKGTPGMILIEARFLRQPDGTDIPATIAREALTLGATGNPPSYLGLIPHAGLVLGAYDLLHHGRDATIPKGTSFFVILGDELALGACSLPSPRPPAQNSAT
jgi:hypothetical protein